MASRFIRLLLNTYILVNDCQCRYLTYVNKISYISKISCIVRKISVLVNKISV